MQSGKYKEVNAIGVASIVAVMNTADGIAIPYVFGGDGASFCIPAILRDKVIHALASVQIIAHESFDLTLRVGIVPVTDIRAMGVDVTIGKYRPNAHYEQAMFSGDGLDTADALIKSYIVGISGKTNENQAENDYLVNPSPEFEADRSLMDGFECRWEEIPANKSEVVNFLIKVISGDRRAIYSEIINALRNIYGDKKTVRPLILMTCSCH